MVGTHLSHSDQELELNEPLRSRTGVEKKNPGLRSGFMERVEFQGEIRGFFPKIDENRMTINNKDTCFII
jgi:hypothetical protein